MGSWVNSWCWEQPSGHCLTPERPSLNFGLVWWGKVRDISALGHVLGACLRQGVVLVTLEGWAAGPVPTLQEWQLPTRFQQHWLGAIVYCTPLLSVQVGWPPSGCGANRKSGEGFTNWLSPVPWSWDSKDLRPHRVWMSWIVNSFWKRSIYYRLYHSLLEVVHVLHPLDRKKWLQNTPFRHCENDARAIWPC